MMDTPPIQNNYAFILFIFHSIFAELINRALLISYLATELMVEFKYETLGVKAHYRHLMMVVLFFILKK